jgi:hypothetical protein
LPSAIYARVGGTFGTEQPPGSGVVNKLVLSKAAKRSAPKAILELLTFVGLPIPRRAIESVLVFDHHFGLHRVRNALDRMHKARPYEVWFETKPVYEGLYETHIFAIAEPTMKHRKLLRAMLDASRDMLTFDELGSAGEKYARRWLIANGFVAVTKTERLGKVTLSSRMRTLARKRHRRLKLPEHSLDVLATEKATGLQYAISVKNHRAWMTRGRSAIPDIITKAKAHKRLPMLFVPFPDAAAIERCQDDGVRLEIIGAQIVPAEDRNKRPMEKIINDLRPVIGPQPYEFLLKRKRR